MTVIKITYMFFLATLFYAYWAALSRLRHRHLPLSPILGWMVGLGYFILAPLTVLVLNGGYSIPDIIGANDRYASVDLSSTTYFLPMAVIWLALLLSFLSVLLFAPASGPVDSKGSPWISERKLKNILLLTSGISLVDYFVEIYMAGGIEAFLVSHWYLRQDDMFTRYGDLYVFYSRVSLANQIIFAAGAALFAGMYLQGRIRNWRFIALIAFFMIAQMVMSGNRIFIALFGLAFLTSCWVYGRKQLMLKLLIISPAVLLIFSVWAYVRHNISDLGEEIATHAQVDVGNRVTTTLIDSTEGACVMILLHMVNDFGSKFDYLNGLSYTKAVTFVLPRRIYPNKPENFPTLLAQLYEPGEITSLGATQLGELYANFGIASVLLLPIVTICLLRLSLRTPFETEKHVLVSAVLFLLVLWSVLASFEDSFITFVFAFLMLRWLRLEDNLSLSSDLKPLPGGPQ
jgi:oligosaccharide repeat unit polymerase